MSALTTLVNRVSTSSHSTRRGVRVFFQLEPIMALAKNGVQCHAIGTKKSFHSESRPSSITEQFRENAPMFNVILAIMTASVFTGAYWAEWNFERAQKEDDLAKERHITALELAFNETALAEERTLQEIASVKKVIALAEERAKADTTVMEARAKAESACVEERAKL